MRINGSRPTAVTDTDVFLRRYPEALKSIKVTLEDVTICVVSSHALKTCIKAMH